MCLFAWFATADVFATEPVTGLWYAPEFDGHGFDLQRVDDRFIVGFYTYSDRAEPVWYFSVATEVAVLFYYDIEGFPRWAFGVTDTGGGIGDVPMQNFRGYCPGCPTAALEPLDAGSINHVIHMENGVPVGRIDLGMVYRFEPGGEWSRAASPLVALSDLQPAFNKLPQTIGADRKVAIIDAGVPLLSGTDAPGFPGVMSGFGVHEEMRLLHEVGIPAEEVFAITTRNAGQFVDDTLNPAVGFGTLEVGKRADLIFTTRNPLDSVEHVERPLAVMARGRFWSQEFLQQELDKLTAQLKTQDLSDPRYQNTESLDFGLHH